MRTEIPSRRRFAALRGGLWVVAALFIAVRFQAQIPAEAPRQPAIHFAAPPHWINDPNGPIRLSGQYHLFFQTNPEGDQWGHMSWGHAVSPDLVHWKQLSLALREENGVAIFSGSTVEDSDNTSGLCAAAGQRTPGCLVAIYTGASADKQTQNLAFTRDAGATWTKYAANPVIDLGLKNFRDPKVFWHAPSRSWIMVVALSDRHQVRFYRSSNLRQWSFAGEFGPVGAVAGAWECPDLFELAVYDPEGRPDGSRWVLSVSVSSGGPTGASAVQYFVGRFDGAHFTEDHPGSGPHWVDWGKDFYASTSFFGIPADQDRIWIAWMSSPHYAAKLPALPGRGQMTMARRLYLQEPPPYPPPTPSQEPLALVQKPVLGLPIDKRYLAMFGAPQFQTIQKANQQIERKKLSGDVYRLRFTLDAGDASEAGVRLRRSNPDPAASATQETVVGIDTAKGRVFVDRSRSGETGWSPDFPVRVSAPLKHPQAEGIAMEIVVDRNSIEVFAEDGETVLSNLIFPAASSQGIAFYSTATPPGTAPARVRDLELIPLGLQAGRK